MKLATLLAETNCTEQMPATSAKAHNFFNMITPCMYG